MPRRLRPEEVALWNKVAASAAPLKNPRSLPSEPENGAAKPPKAKKEPVNAPPVSIASMPEPSQRQARFTPATDPFTALANDKPRMDAKAHAKLKRGKLTPEARLDLHGMTLAEARPALTRFIMAQASKGARLVLVITGKGRGGQDVGPLPVRRGAMKHAVPEWLAMAPLRSIVLQTVPAHARHGGHGALYVYLRRSKSS